MALEKNEYELIDIPPPTNEKDVETKITEIFETILDKVQDEKDLCKLLCQYKTMLLAQRELLKEAKTTGLPYELQCAQQLEVCIQAYIERKAAGCNEQDEKKRKFDNALKVFGKTNNQEQPPLNFAITDAVTSAIIGLGSLGLGIGLLWVGSLFKSIIYVMFTTAGVVTEGCGVYYGCQFKKEVSFKLSFNNDYKRGNTDIASKGRALSGFFASTKFETSVDSVEREENTDDSYKDLDLSV